jgi:hypothetical protein
MVSAKRVGTGELAFADVVLRARVVPELAGARSSALGKAIKWHGSSAYASCALGGAIRSINAEASKGMDMAIPTWYSVWLHTGFDLFQAHVSGTEGCLRRQAVGLVRSENPAGREK